MLDMNDVTQLMESMGISTHHRLVLKATFTGWKKSPGAAFEALASAKVAHVQHTVPLQLCDVRLQAAAADKALRESAAAKKKQYEAAAAQKKVRVVLPCVWVQYAASCTICAARPPFLTLLTPDCRLLPPPALQANPTSLLQRKVATLL